MRLFRPGFLAVRLFPEALFRGKTTEKVLYLTFDDGPDVISTIPLLNILSKNKVRAVFFCSGKAASENPDLIIRIKSEGHIIGNHGYYHLNGLLTSKHRYLIDIEKAAVVRVVAGEFFIRYVTHFDLLRQFDDPEIFLHYFTENRQTIAGVDRVQRLKIRLVAVCREVIAVRNLNKIF